MTGGAAGSRSHGPIGPDLAEAALRAAVGAGARSADLFLKKSASLEVVEPAGAVERSSERGAALRVFLPDGRSALAAATLPRDPASLDATLARLAAAAAAAAALAPSGSPAGLPGGRGTDGRGLGLFDPDLAGSGERILESARAIYETARARLAPAQPVVRLRAVVGSVRLHNTSGFHGAYRQTHARLDLTVRAAEGAPSSTRVLRAARSLRGLLADAAVAEAAALLEERDAPRLPPSGIHQVLLAPRAAAEIVAALSAWLGRASSAATGPGPARGERIASSAITLTDDGRLPGGVASAPFDGEGTPTHRTVLVQRGVVRDGIRDLEEAVRARAEAGRSAGSEETSSTGNGVRASFREAPSLRFTNLFVNPGTDAPDALLASMKQGIRISTLGPITPLPGLDAPFVAPFTGRWVHNGAPGAALAGGYLAGNLREILGEVEAAGSDLAFTPRRGSFGSPSLLLARAPVRSA